MKPRVTLALALVAAVLGTAYWYWEIKTKPLREAAKEEAKKVFPGPAVQNSGEILLRATGKPEVLLRKIDGVWNLITPVVALADGDAVKAIIEQLSSVKRDEVVDEKAEELRKYGLDNPSGAVTFKPLSSSAKAQVLFFGADSFDGSKAYGLVDGSSQVFLTALAGKTALLKDSNGLREKHLLNFDPALVASVKSNSKGGFSLVRDAQGFWKVQSGAQVEPANLDKVTPWLNALKDIKGDSVEDEWGKSPGKYGLSTGGLQVQVVLKDGTRLGLTKGKLQAKGPAFFASVQGKPQIWVVPGTASATLEQEGRALMNLSAFDLKPGLVQKMTVWQDGITMTAKRVDLKWSWQAPFTPKLGAPAFDFDNFVVKVSGTERLKRLPESARPTKPALIVTFYGPEDALMDQAIVGPKQGQGQLAQSAVKHDVMIVAGNVFDGLPKPEKK